ncbi:SLC25A51 [Cordylochernes scorpioides]|uniref:SLC25A51 n=1 Tax=Cordylochernes scorpioides TaxID=51811 RepID=A0ABY6JWQ8_9ARAC|nr:SLC25A51 [Cordylochernes scorpioides]
MPELSEEYICGFGSALTNVGLTYPIHKVIFRQMMHGFRSMEALRQLHGEGIISLYRGFFPPLCQKSISLSIMFGSYQQYLTHIETHAPRVHPFAVSATAAMLSGCTEALLTPFERVQTLLQDRTQQARFQNSWNATRQLCQFGPREFYRGFTAILIRNGPSNLLYLELRGVPKEYLGCLGVKSKSRMGDLAMDFLSGGVVGGSISTLIYPVNLVKCKMQVTYATPFTSFLRTFRDVYAERNFRIRNLFFGAKVNFIRSLISWGITNASYEFIMSTFFPHHKRRKS